MISICQMSSGDNEYISHKKRDFYEVKWPKKKNTWHRLEAYWHYIGHMSAGAINKVDEIDCRVGFEHLYIKSHILFKSNFDTTPLALPFQWYQRFTWLRFDTSLYIYECRIQWLPFQSHSLKKNNRNEISRNVQCMARISNNKPCCE